MKKLFSFLICAVLSLTVWVETAAQDTIRGTWYNTTYTLYLPDSVLVFEGNGNVVQNLTYPWDSIKSKVKHLRVEGTITMIPDQMLDSAANLESVWMSDNVKIINSTSEVYFYGAFADCHKLKSVHLSSNLTTIGWGAFFQDTKLQEIEIPATVKSIGYWSFYGCSGMTSITCLSNTPPSVANTTFTKTNIPLYVPSGSVAAYQAASYWKNFTILPLVVGVEPIAPDSTELSWLPVNNASRYELHLHSDSIDLDTTLVIYADSLNGGIMLQGDPVARRQHRIVLNDISSILVIIIDPNSGATTSSPFVVTVSTPSQAQIPIQFEMKVYSGDNLLKEDEGNFTLNYDYYQQTGIEEIPASCLYSPASKLFRDGQIVILRNGQYYDLTGRRLE